MKAAGTSAVFLTIYQTTRPHIVITNCEYAGVLCEDGACTMKSVSYFAVYFTTTPVSHDGCKI
jgi:hypothetical protein